MREFINIVEGVDVFNPYAGDIANTPARKAVMALLDEGMLGYTATGGMHVEIEGSELINLERLYVDEQGSGHGTEMMQTLCRCCDAFGVEITLIAEPFSHNGQPEMPIENLMVFYEKFGFQDDNTSNEMGAMIRFPR